MGRVDFYQSNFKKRNFFTSWLENKPKDQKAKDVVTSAAESIPTTVPGCIIAIRESFVEFDFVTYLKNTDGKWEIIWNTMSLFFVRGMFFGSRYHPMEATGRRSLLKAEGVYYGPTIDGYLDRPYLATARATITMDDDTVRR